MYQNEIVATPTAIDAASQFANIGYQQIDAEFARYEAEAAALKQRMDALAECRKGMRQQACNEALPEIVERMTLLGITLEQVRVALAAAKPAAPVVDKYRNPETGETHSGKGGCPGWLTPEAKKDLRYRNPAWTAKKAAVDAAKKNKIKSSGASVAVSASASIDAPAMANGGERNVVEGGAAMAVANEAVVDVANTGSNVPNATIVSSIN